MKLLLSSCRKGCLIALAPAYWPNWGTTAWDLYSNAGESKLLQSSCSGGCLVAFASAYWP
jgi:hypothetical protein